MVIIMDEERKNPADMSEEEFFAYLNELAEQDEEDAPEEGIPAGAEDVAVPEEIPAAEPEPQGEPIGTEGEAVAPVPAPEPEPVQKPEQQGAEDIIARITDYAKLRYPESGDAVAELLNEFDGELAAGRGVSAEEYRNSRRDEREFEQWKRERDDRRAADEGAQQVISQWESDAQKLRAFVPEFDLRTALQNEGFKKSLLAGEDVFSAYKKANPVSQPPAREPGISEVGARALHGGAQEPGDINKLPRDEFMKRMKRIMEE